MTGSLRASCGASVSRPPAEASLGEWAGGSRAQLSEGLVMLPKPGQQELICQVVSSDDPHNLGKEKTTESPERTTHVRTCMKRTVPADVPQDVDTERTGGRTGLVCPRHRLPTLRRHAMSCLRVSTAVTDTMAKTKLGRKSLFQLHHYRPSLSTVQTGNHTGSGLGGRN